MRKQNNDWLWIIGFVVFAVIALVFNTWNTIQVCKNQDVYWVNGTQHTCKLFKE